MLHYRRLHCFIIKRSNYQEADKIITVFSLEKGKLALIAKGIRKITSKRASSLELFNLVEILVYKTGGLDVITEVKLLNSYSNFGSDYNKTFIAYQIVELIDKLTAEKEDHRELYHLLRVAFNYLGSLSLFCHSRTDNEVNQQLDPQFNLRDRESDLSKANSQISQSKTEQIIIRFQKRILDTLGFGIPADESLASFTSYIENIIEKKLFTPTQMKI